MEPGVWRDLDRLRRQARLPGLRRHTRNHRLGRRPTTAKADLWLGRWAERRQPGLGSRAHEPSSEGRAVHRPLLCRGRRHRGFRPGGGLKVEAGMGSDQWVPDACRGPECVYQIFYRAWARRSGCDAVAWDAPCPWRSLCCKEATERGETPCDFSPLSRWSADTRSPGPRSVRPTDRRLQGWLLLWAHNHRRQPAMERNPPEKQVQSLLERA